MRLILRLVVLVALMGATIAFPPVAPAKSKRPEATPTAVGTGGAVASVDPYATKIGLDVLRSGGNAIDAAVAAAAALGVVEPYSCGIGGGGFMVIRAANGDITTIDGRETAPAAFQPDSFQENGTTIPFAERVTSGLGVGVPGTVRTWELALERYGTRSLNRLMQPSIRLARNGFVVDPTFTAQTRDNLSRFRDFTSTAETFLVDDQPPEPGTILDNDDLAETYERISKSGGRALYGGAIAADIVETVQDPPVRPGTTRNVRPGLMTSQDLADYRAKWRDPTRVDYRGVEVVGMGPPSSGGSTVGEALNILEALPATTDPVTVVHRYLEASKLSFADRGAYLGDSDFVAVPLRGLLSDGFATERAGLVSDTSALTAPVAAGDPWPYEQAAAPQQASGSGNGREGRSTTHLTVADRAGNVVSYTFTIESTGGSAITVPDRGFLLNNELTDFEPVPGLPNSPAGGKRPRSSMSPTIVLRDGAPVLAVGSPGGSTIITTVLQILVNRFDLGMTLPDAVAAPRLSQRNTPTVLPEPGFAGSPLADALAQRGHTFGTPAEIGAATGIELFSDGRLQAVAEPTRRGGGSAMVLNQQE